MGFVHQPLAGNIGGGICNGVERLFQLLDSAERGLAQAAEALKNAVEHGGGLVFEGVTQQGAMCPAERLEAIGLRQLVAQGAGKGGCIHVAAYFARRAAPQHLIGAEQYKVRQGERLGVARHAQRYLQAADGGGVGPILQQAIERAFGGVIQPLAFNPVQQRSFQQMCQPAHVGALGNAVSAGPEADLSLLERIAQSGQQCVEILVEHCHIKRDSRLTGRVFTLLLGVEGLRWCDAELIRRPQVHGAAVQVVLEQQGHQWLYWRLGRCCPEHGETLEAFKVRIVANDPRVAIGKHAEAFASQQLT